MPEASRRSDPSKKISSPLPPFLLLATSTQQTVFIYLLPETTQNIRSHHPLLVGANLELP